MTKRDRRSAKPTTTHGAFVVRIEKILDLEFSLSLNPDEWPALVDLGPRAVLMESREIRLSCTMVRAPVVHFDPAIEVRLSFDDELNNVENREQRLAGLLGIGGFEKIKGKVSFTLHLPSATMAPILIGLQSEALRFISIVVADPMKSDGRVLSWTLSGQIEPE